MRTHAHACTSCAPPGCVHACSHFHRPRCFRIALLQVHRCCTVSAISVPLCRRLNTAVLLNAVFVIILVGSTYAVADHMDNWYLGALMAVATVPTLRATLPGLRAQGLLDSDTLRKTLGSDIDALAHGA